MARLAVFLALLFCSLGLVSDTPSNLALGVPPSATIHGPIQGPRAFASPTVTLPIEIRGEPGQFVRILAQSSGPEVRWYSCDHGLNLFPVDLLKDSKTAVAVALRPGRYRLLAWTAQGDVPSEAAVCVVTIGDPPNPGPDPPNPPLPPVDPFLAALQAAFASDLDPGKVGHKANLSALYRQGASMVSTRTELKTWGELFDVMTQAAATLGVKGKLMPLQGVLQSKLASALPTARTTALDAGGRKLAHDTFTSISDYLDKVK